MESLQYPIWFWNEPKIKVAITLIFGSFQNHVGYCTGPIIYDVSVDSAI